MSIRPHIPQEGQAAEVLEPHCRTCRFFKALFYRDGKPLFKIAHFRSASRRDEAIRVWSAGATQAEMAEKYRN